MYSRIITGLCFFYILAGVLKAQPQFSASLDAGRNSVSNGLFAKTALFLHYSYKKYSIGTGCQFNLINQVEIIDAKKNIFSGYNSEGSRVFLIKKFPVKLHAFFTWRPFTDVLRETNWGVTLGIECKHLQLDLGTNFRTLAFSHKAINEFDLSADYKIRESWNIVYSFAYYVKPIEHKWNIGLRFTDYDNFIVSLETNPAVNLNASYKLSPLLKLYAEYWRKSAGALNTNVNYFGFFVRTGIIWMIK